MNASCRARSRRRCVPATIAALVHLLALLSGCAADPVEDTARYEVDLSGAPIRGAANPAVVLVEFIDIECPYCASTARNTKALLDLYPEELQLAFRHYPLESIHARALSAAIAVECAGEQGLFWQMLDSLVAPDARLSDPALREHAEALELDLDAFERCLSSEGPVERIARDRRLAGELGVRATPTIFLNGRRLVGARSVDALAGLVEEELWRSSAATDPDAGIGQ